MFLAWQFKRRLGTRTPLVSSTTNRETFRRRRSKSRAHVTTCILTFKGKLTRSEVMKDSVEVEALNEALKSMDTPNTPKESQLARLYYRNGKINKHLTIKRWILDISQKSGWYGDGVSGAGGEALVRDQALSRKSWDYECQLQIGIRRERKRLEERT